MNFDKTGAILMIKSMVIRRNSINIKIRYPTVITSTFKAKSNQLLQIKTHQMREVDYRLSWGNIEIKLQQV